MFTNQQSENNFFNGVDLAAFIISIMNLYENRQQSAYNDVHSANDEQAQFLLQEIDRRFQEQNVILEKQNEILIEQNRMLFNISKRLGVVENEIKM